MGHSQKWGLTLDVSDNEWRGFPVACLIPKISPQGTTCPLVRRRVRSALKYRNCHFGWNPGPGMCLWQQWVSHHTGKGQQTLLWEGNDVVYLNKWCSWKKQARFQTQNHFQIKKLFCYSPVLSDDLLSLLHLHTKTIIVTTTLLTTICSSKFGKMFSCTS